ncbi:diadenylate cyclase CdaA [Desulfothermus naphthae]
MNKLLNVILSTITLKDILDILINSYILFRIYVLFYGTAIFRVLIGVVLLFICQRLSSYAGLIMTSYILQGIITVALFVIIIGFRHELRGILQTKKIGDIFWRVKIRRVKKSHLYDVIGSVFSLSEKKVGALIVIPGKNSVNPFISGGVKIDSLISKELIESIFMSKGPLHDGAIVLEDGKIQKAGVILPLSEREDLPPYYGTRHRAALGLSEVCDALVILVSEERGSVSIAISGEIFQIYDNKDLDLILNSHLGDRVKNKSKKGYISYSFAAIMCFFIVTGVWFTFTRGETSIASLNIPVEIMKGSSNIDIVTTTPNTIKLTLTGPRVILRSINKNDIDLFLKVKDQEPGTYLYDITEKNISLPPGIKIVKIEPSRIKIKLDKIVSKLLPIQVDWAGKLPKDILIPDVKVVPDKVHIIGPKTLLDSISTIYTEKVKVDNINKSGKINVELKINPALKIKEQSHKIKIKYIVKKRN